MKEITERKENTSSRNNKKRKQAEKVRKIQRILTALCAAALVGIALVCTSATVHSSEKIERRDREKYYRELEEAYVEEVRLFLTEEGFRNSGITMTKVIDEDESRSYTVTIHHRRMDHLEPEEQERLYEELSHISCEGMNGKVTYLFV